MNDGTSRNSGLEGLFTLRPLRNAWRSSLTSAAQRSTRHSWTSRRVSRSGLVTFMVGNTSCSAGGSASILPSSAGALSKRSSSGVAVRRGSSSFTQRLRSKCNTVYFEPPKIRCSYCDLPVEYRPCPECEGHHVWGHVFDADEGWTEERIDLFLKRHPDTWRAVPIHRWWGASRPRTGSE